MLSTRVTQHKLLLQGVIKVCRHTVVKVLSNESGKQCYDGRQIHVERVECVNASVKSKSCRCDDSFCRGKHMACKQQQRSVSTSVEAVHVTLHCHGYAFSEDQHEVSYMVSCNARWLIMPWTVDAQLASCNSVVNSSVIKHCFLPCSEGFAASVAKILAAGRSIKLALLPSSAPL